MGEASFPVLVQNIALLLALVLIVDVISPRWPIAQRSLGQVLVGIVIGAIGITLMLTPWVQAPGLVFDTRSVLLGISGLFFGGIPTLVAMAITVAFRIYQGGSGALTGVSVILATGTIGILWRQARKRPSEIISWWEIYLFGVVIHLVMLALMFTLPLPTALQTLANISLPVLVIYPLGTTLIGALITNRMQREQTKESLRRSEIRLNVTQHLTKVGGWEWDVARKQMYWTEETYRIHGYSPADIPAGSPEHIEKSLICYDPEDRLGGIGISGRRLRSATGPWWPGRRPGPRLPAQGATKRWAGGHRRPAGAGDAERDSERHGDQQYGLQPGLQQVRQVRR